MSDIPLVFAASRWLPLLAALAAVPAVAAEEPLDVPSPLSLVWCQERAASSNPEVAADAARAEAARQRIVPAGSLEDPRFGYQASNLPVNSLDFDSTPLSGNQLTLSQKLPFPGLLGARKEGARAAARAREASLADRRLRVAAEVERAWADLGFAQRALEVTDRNLGLLRQLARIAETKYAVGIGLQQDVLLAQVELTRRLDERLAREAAIAREEARLARLLDLPRAAALPRTLEIDDTTPVPELPGLLERAEQVSPRLRALASEIEEAERLHRVAQLEGRPDFDLDLGWRLRQRVTGDVVDGEDFVSAGVRVRLPLARGKWRARVAERLAGVRRAKAIYQAARAALRDAVRVSHAELRRSDASLGLLRSGLVPQSRHALDSSRSAYEVDKVDFLRLIDAQVSLLEAELGLLRAGADRRNAFAGLEAELGETLR